jgi:glycosyltransferase involved in cell wall biosynthesis
MTDETLAGNSRAAGDGAPLVSVIIPHHNDLANLKRCIDLLAAQTVPRSQFEIVVADNNSSCGLSEVESACGALARVVPAPVQGAGPARNAAIVASLGDILAFTDSDCRPARDWLERGLAALSNVDADLVGGRVDVDVGDPAHPTAVEAFEIVFAFNLKRYVERLSFSAAANMFVPREIFDRVGPFRARVTEDLEWGKRASAANYRWRYAANVVVTHPARSTWAELWRKWRRRSEEDFELALEHPLGRAIWLLRSFAILGSPFVHWFFVVRSNKLRGVPQRLMAIAVLFRIRFRRFIECYRLLLRH